jgi:hypothetical protein
MCQAMRRGQTNRASILCLPPVLARVELLVPASSCAGVWALEAGRLLLVCGVVQGP